MSIIVVNNVHVIPKFLINFSHRNYFKSIGVSTSSRCIIPFLKWPCDIGNDDAALRFSLVMKRKWRKRNDGTFCSTSKELLKIKIHRVNLDGSLKKLIRMFHTDRDDEVAKLHEVRQVRYFNVPALARITRALCVDIIGVKCESRVGFIEASGL